jgi:hypothetical protein
MNERNELPVYFGQVEKSLDGSLWAAVYRGDPATSGSLVRQERVPSMRLGKRRVAEMIMEQRDLEKAQRRQASRNESREPPTNR